LYNDQRNAQVFNLCIYLLLPYMFQAFFSPSSEAGVQIQQWFKSAGYGVSAPALLAQALITYPADLNHYRNCTPASEDGPKESPKHVRQK
jgi:hypothetical protein